MIFDVPETWRIPCEEVSAAMDETGVSEWQSPRGIGVWTANWLGPTSGRGLGKTWLNEWSVYCVIYIKIDEEKQEKFSGTIYIHAHVLFGDNPGGLCVYMYSIYICVCVPMYEK